METAMCLYHHFHLYPRRSLVKSWKMNEYKYYDIPSPFPTLARGLFTQDIKDASGNVKHRIVARGYDKFFNIGEVPWTHVSNLLINPRGLVLNAII